MNARRSISEDELRAFRTSLRLLVRKIARQLRDETQCCGVGYAMCHVLLELDGKPGLSLKDLETALEIDKAALSRSVEFLVKDGFVSRVPNPEDRRAVRIALTAAGRRKVEELHRAGDERHRELFRLIPEKEHATVLCAVDYLARAYDGLTADAVYCPPAAKPKVRRSAQD